VAPVQRVVSLLPSLTEITCALGARGRLVGRSHECDHPPGVEALPICTEPKLPVGAPSRAIDDSVRALVERGLSVYRVEAGRLRALAPDLVLTQDHCRVCAASLADVEAALGEWTGSQPRVLSVAPTSLADVFESFRRVGEALALPERGEALAGAVRERIDGIARAAAALSSRPRVACIEWIDPLMGAGNWMPELVRLAGGTPCLGRPGERSEAFGWQALCAADPEVILLTPCGFDVPRIRRELPPLLERPGFPALRAVRSKRVFLADGSQLFNRPGPRLAESLEVLAEVLHPGRFAFGHAGRFFEAL
jgi:iron complex transport system substrate-binding protein